MTALELASAGIDVLVIEEGGRHALAEYGQSAPEAMKRLYRRRGMTPVMGSVPIGYVEGRCLGGSTEINSGFWHRTRLESLSRWKSRFGLADASATDLEPHFVWAERQVSVSRRPKPLPPSTEVFRRGIERMGWAADEVPRMVTACDCRLPCPSGCSTGGKQSMSRSLLPQAERAGARVLTGCRAHRLVRAGGRVTGVMASVRREDGGRETVRIDADHIFVCAGPTETPALLRRSGVKAQVGRTLGLHPMLKVAARFPEPLHASEGPLPLLQVTEFWPDMSFGGAFTSKGHLAMHLSENWPVLAGRMQDAARIATYYVAVLGKGRGSVSPGWWAEDATTIRYELADADCANLSRGLSRLSSLLLAAGADEVYPCVQGLPVIRSAAEAGRWMDDQVPRQNLSLTTVHAFSTCPIGEHKDLTAADSFGRIHEIENLFVNDASMLPDSPGVNPQGSIMALARRNALHFMARKR